MVQISKSFAFTIWTDKNNKCLYYFYHPLEATLQVGSAWAREAFSMPYRHWRLLPPIASATNIFVWSCSSGGIFRHFACKIASATNMSCSKPLVSMLRVGYGGVCLCAASQCVVMGVIGHMVVLVNCIEFGHFLIDFIQIPNRLYLCFYRGDGLKNLPKLTIEFLMVWFSFWKCFGCGCFWVVADIFN